MKGIEELTTDLLVVGGGVAGLNAALTAVRAGVEVTVLDKAVIERSGHIAGGVDHFLAYLETGPAWDTRDAYLDFTARSARGATDPAVVEEVYCAKLADAIARFDEVGVPLARADGSFFRTRSYGQPGPWWINFNGKRLKPALAAAARRAGVRVLDRVAGAELLVRDGRVCGAVGVHGRTSAVVAVAAKAVLLATGGTNRLFQNPTGLSFNTWMCPADTGDAEAMGYRGGAALANVEYLRLTVVPRGFSAAGLNALVGMGGKLLNGAGEEFMSRYHPEGMGAPRYKLAEGVLGELRERRGPVSMDCRHLDRDALRHLVTTLAYDKDTLPDFFRQKGLDLTRDLLEVGPSEGMQGGPNELCGSGLKIDGRCRTTLEGLYAAGNSADQCRSLHMAVTSGLRAGECAAAQAAETRAPEIPRREVEALRERLLSPLGRSGELDWREYEDALQRVVTEGLGPVRSASGLARCREQLSELVGWEGRVGVDSGHDLCRFREVSNLRTVASCMAAAAEFRTESRFGLSHRRSDHPGTDDARWLGQVLVRRSAAGPAAGFLPLSP